MKKILIVGEQNIFRSIIIAEILNFILKQKGKNDFEVKSAGIFAMLDIPMEEEAKTELKKYVNSDFSSKPLLKQDVKEADIILTINSKIKNAILNKFPEKNNAIFTVKEFAGESEVDFINQKITAEEAIEVINKFINKI